MAKALEQVAVLGGRGMLGSEVGAALRAAGHAVRSYDLPECDVTAPAALEAALEGVTAVVNCAAFTAVDAAESQASRAMAVNGEAPGVLGRLAASRGIYVLHVSTDFVFDGALDRPYREDDAARPLSVYGASKLAGERALAAAGGAQATVRVQWTYGAAGANFVSRFLERAASTTDLMMVADQVGAPTWTGDVAAALVHLLARRATGLFHYAAAGAATRYEVAAAILALRGLYGRRLEACRTADLAAAARRPLNSRFDCSRVDAMGIPARPPWREALARFLETSA
ncbi:MAG: dTDP-4-dehydrorhamnose reductase [Lentisphaerae bacterium]|nr:dTDP-4-dehydrorhamnose reductase [Lentisphaerota bacterium]